MWLVSFRPGKAGYVSISAALLAGVAVGLTVIAAGRGGPHGHDVQATLRGHLAGRIPRRCAAFSRTTWSTNPQALQEALVVLMQRRMPSAADRTAVIKSNAPALFDSGNRMALGNPAGDVTLVEFIDYNCGFCRRALGDMLELAKTDANLKSC